MYQGKFQSDPIVDETPAPAEQVRTAPVNPRRRRPQPKRRGPTKGTLLFYAAYLAAILLFFICLTIGMIFAKNWLADFQASQPDTASRQVFADLFEQPDWGELYLLANPGSTNEKAVAAYIAHMTEQVGSDKLSFVETSGGTSVKKYYVLHGRQVVAAFSIAPVTGADGSDQWQFDNVEVYFNWACNLTYSILVQPGCVVTANGEKLGEDDIFRKISTKADEYLPSGVRGYQMVEYQVNGLEAKPEISVVDAKGNPVELTFNESAKSFTQVLPDAPTITDEQSKLIRNTAEAYAKFIIAGGTTEMRKYFDSNSAIYKTITGGMIIRQSFTKYEFTSCEITDYYRYSDTVFSAKIKLITTVHSTKYGVQDKEVDSTFIFKKANGKWVVHDMLNLDIQEQVQTVRVTFQNAAGDELSSKLVEVGSPLLTAPSVTAPAGKVFKGWQEKRIDEQGNINLVDAVYPVNDSNAVSISKLANPMILVPVFEDAEVSD